MAFNSIHIKIKTDIYNLYLGTPFDTPCGISNAGSVTDLKKPENHTPNSGVETPDETQLYALEGTPGCFSRTDSVENLDEHIEKGQKEAAEGPSEKGMQNKSFVDHVCILYRKSIRNVLL